MSMPIPDFLNPTLVRAIARETGTENDEVNELASIIDKDVTLADFIEALRPSPCVNQGCDNPRSNYADECFECRFEPFGSEWQREQEERGWR